MARGWRAIALLLGVATLTAHAQDRDPLDLESGSEWDMLMQLAPPAEPEPEPKDDKSKTERSSRKHRKSTHKQRKERSRSSGSSNYDALKRSWHEAPSDEDVLNVDTALVPALVLRVIGEQAPFVLVPSGERGEFSSEQIAVASKAFGSWDGGPQVHPRLLDLIYQATRHFDVPYVHLVSGIRRDRSASRHSHGLAGDIVLPGVNDEELAAWFRAQGFVGVGTYPRAGFVHIDVREKSYFWVDRSAPGTRSRMTQVRADEAKATDEAALARGEGPLDNPERLQRALNSRAARRRKSSGKHKHTHTASAATHERKKRSK